MLLCFLIWAGTLSGPASQSSTVVNLAPEASSSLSSTAMLMASSSILGVHLWFQFASQNAPPARTFRLDERVEVSSPGHQLLLAEETEIPLIIHAQGLTKVSTVQSHVAGENEKQTTEAIQGSTGVVPVLYHP